MALAPEPPAGVVKVAPVRQDAPEAVKAFRDWSKRYFNAEPKDRKAMITEGEKLADAHRVALGKMIPESPKAALDNAVPMVVRQDLPPQIVAKLEQRLNKRGELALLGAVPAATGVQLGSPPIFRMFMPEKPIENQAAPEIYRAFVYGDRARMRTVKSARVSGVAVDGQLAVLDSPIRRLETGERLDPAKPVDEVCPISGETTILSRDATTQVSPVTDNKVVVEDDKRIIVLCSGGHIQAYGENLSEEEARQQWQDNRKVMAEGGTGGGITPFNVPTGWTTGTSTLLYLRVAFPDSMQDPQSEASVYNTLKQVTDYFMDSSYGRFYITPTVAPLIVLPYPEAWYRVAQVSASQGGEFVLRNHALAIAKRMGYDTNNYDLDVVEYRGGPGSFGGLGYVGAKGVWVKTSAIGVLAHELGHNLGLWHSNFWQTNPPSLIGPGSNLEYGNIFDVMGNSGSMGHYVAPHKAELGWITTDAYHRVYANGTYRIYQTDQGQADSDKRYALAVSKDSEREYWLDFRQGFPAIPSLASGVMVMWSPWGSGNADNSPFGSNGGAQLLDMSPGSGALSDTRNDAGLPLGMTFSDTEADLHITPITKSSTSPPYVDVVVNRGPFTTNQAPTLSISGSTTLNFVSPTGTYTASAIDPDGDAVVYYWDFGDGSFSTNNFSTQSHTWSATGKYRVTCTASDMKGKRTTRAILVSVGIDNSVFTVSGVVKDSSGNPIEGVLMTNSPLTSSPNKTGTAAYRYAYTDSNGAYTITNLPSGTTTIYASLYPLAISPDVPSTFNLAADVTGKNWSTSGTGTIQTVNLAVTPGAATEAAGANHTKTITLTRPSSTGTLSVQVGGESNGTASYPGDYTLNPAPSSNSAGLLGYHFTNGQSTISITFTAVTDATSEGEEYAVIEFPNTVGSTYLLSGPRSLTIPITDAQSTLPVVSLVIDDPSASESGDTAVVRLKRNGATTSPLTVTLNYGGQGVSGTDFTSTGSLTSVVIPAGSASTSFTISAVDDKEAEGIEPFTVSLVSSGSYQRDTQQRTGTIYIADNDQPVLTVVATTPSVAEASATPGKFTITRVATDISQDLTVEFSLGGTALSGNDYRRVEGVAVIPANEASVDIEIQPFNDTIDEADQTVICRLSTNDEYAITPPGSATVTIVDDDSTQFTIQSLVGATTEPSVAPLTRNLFAVSRPAGGTSVSVKYSVTGSATAGSDYTALTGTLSFSASDTTLNIPVTLLNDGLNENAETITVTLLVGTGYRLGFETKATATILDAFLPAIDVSYSDNSSAIDNITEPTSGSTAVRFRFSRTGATTTPRQVAFTLAGTAVYGTDYTIATTSTQSPTEVTIQGGQAGVDLVINYLSDAIAEGTETLIVNVAPDPGYGIRSGSSTLRISDVDAYTGSPAPSVSFSVASSVISERTGIVGSTASVAVALNVAQATPVSVEYRVSGGSATGQGVDYTFAAGTLTFAPGDPPKTISLTTTPDIFPEGDESIVLQLLNPVGANLGAVTTHTVTITDLAMPEAFTDAIVGLPNGTTSLRGHVYANNSSTTAWFEWGTTKSFGTETTHVNVGTATGSAALAATISGLTYPGTYYYRTVAQSAAGTTKGVTRMIRTVALPTVATLPKLANSASSITLAGSVNPNRLALRAWFEWGTTTSYGNTTPVQEVTNQITAQNLSATITGLAEGTIYHYRLVVNNGLGTFQGADVTAAAVAQKVAGDLLVNVNATHGSAGTAAWVNQGSLGGVFVRTGGAALDSNVDGRTIPGVAFNGVDSSYAGPAATADIAANDPRSIEVWTLNPGFGLLDSIISLGRDGTRTQAVITHANASNSSGAFMHGPAAVDNLPYTSTTLPSLGEWHHIVYTYDGAKKATVYVDGALKITKTLSGNLATTTDPIMLGAALDAAGLPTNRFHGFINSARIHGGLLSAADVLFNFNLGPTAPAPDVPAARVAGASAITPNSVTLNGFVFSNGLPTTAWFEWTTGADFNNASVPVSIPAGRAWVPITLPLPGLANGIPYAFRVVAKNSIGETPSEVGRFMPGVLKTAGPLYVDIRATNLPVASEWPSFGGLGDLDNTDGLAVQNSAAGSGVPGIELDGVKHLVALRESPNDIAFGSDQTIEAWVLNPTLDQLNEVLVQEGGAGAAQSTLQLAYGSTGGVLDGQNSDDWSEGIPQGVPVINAWHHIVVVHTGAARQLYVDGVKRLETPLLTGSNIWNTPLVIGGPVNRGFGLLAGTAGFSGFLNSLRVHGGALTAADILSNFQSGPAQVPAPLGAAPLVETLAATQVTGAGAVLNGTVRPGGLATTATVEWGDGTTTMGTVAIPVTSTFATQSISLPIGGLTSGTTYYFRVSATNAQGTVQGVQLSFVAGGTVANLPTAVTSPATLLGPKKATLNGTATPGGLAANAWFEYGVVPQMGSTTAKVAITAATVSKVMNAPLTTLLPHSNYQYRLMVENATGRVAGAVQTFSTTNTAPLATLGSISINEDTATTLALKGTDADGEVLAIVVTTPPAHGTLVGTTLAPVYTPALNYVGTDSFQFAVTDGAATSPSVTFSITIKPVNDVPIAQGSSFTIAEDSGAHSGTLTAVDPESDPVVSFAAATLPSKGTLSVLANGSFTYTPTLNANGADSFTFVASNSAGTSQPALVTVTLTPVQDAPVALGGAFFIEKDGTLSDQAPASDPDGDVLTYTQLSAASHGTAALASDGSFVYTPTAAFVGIDSFTFKINDGTADSGTGTITITVGMSLAEDGHFTGFRDDLLTDTLSATDPNGDPMTFSLVNNASHGSVVVDADGTFRYNPESNFIGTDSFTFRVHNGTGYSNPATAFLTIVDRPPNWIWTGGSSVAKKSGVYGDLNVPHAANIPGARSDAAVWNAPDGTMWMFGGNGYGSGTTPGLLNDLWKRDSLTGAWTWLGGSKLTNQGGNYGAQGLTAPTNMPGARSGALAWLDPMGTKLWLFGGTGRDASAAGSGLLNDLWFFDLGTGRWTWVQGSNFINANGLYGTQHIPAAANAPGARVGAAGWVDAMGRLWLFGGSGRGATGATVGNLNDLWCYDLPITGQWTWVGGVSAIDPNGVYNLKGEASSTGVPSGRSYASAWCGTDGLFYLFGGSGKGATGATKGNLNDLWCYDPQSNAWTWLTGSSAVNGVASYGTLGVPSLLNTPGARSGATVVQDGTSNTLLFGGQGAGAMNDLWRYDSTGEWVWLKGPQTPNGVGVYGSLGVGAPGNTPGARRGSVAIQDGSSNTILFGGANGANNFNDVWMLDEPTAPVIQVSQGVTMVGADPELHFEVNPNGLVTEFYVNVWPISDPLSGSTYPMPNLEADTTFQVVDVLATGLADGAYMFQAVAHNAAGTSYSNPMQFEFGAPLGAEVNFASVSSTVSEDGLMATANLVLSEPSPVPVTVQLIVSGTATSGTDFTAPATTVTFGRFQTSAVVSIPIKNDTADEGAETIILTIDSSSAGIGLDDSVVFTITDDEDLPVIGTDPVSQFVKVGDPVSFTIAATGPGLKYQWKKNGVNIAGATTATYSIAAAALTSAGNYQCAVTNAVTGTTPVNSAIAELFVVDGTSSKTVATTGSKTFTVNAAGPTGSTLAYAWRDSVTNPIADVPGHRTGTTTKSLVLTGLVPTDSEYYVCKVSKTGSLTLFHDSGTFTLAVMDQMPVVTTSSLPVAVVGVPYSYQVTVDPALRKMPTSFIFSGLPPGLTGNATTGLVSGKPTTAGAASVLLSAKNTLTSAVVGPLTLTVVGLPDPVKGSFAGLIDKTGTVPDAGGRFEISVTPLGAFTAKVLLPGVTGTNSFTGAVVPAFTGTTVTSVVGTATFKLAGGVFGIVRPANSPASLSFTIDANTGAVTGSFVDRGNTYPLVGGVRNVWGTTPAPKAGDFTSLFDIPTTLVGDYETPQGSGYSTFKVATNGTLTFAGKTADGLAFTLGTFTGPAGEIVGISTFSGGTSVLWGAPTIGAGNYLTGTLSWKKGVAAAASTDMAYRAGFDWIGLTVAGSNYPVINNGDVFMGLTNVDGNAKLTFLEGGLESGNPAPFTFNIRNNNLTKNIQTITYPTVNPAKVSFALGATPLGSFSGKFTINNPVTTLLRTITYQGVVTKTGASTYRTAGFFLVPQLPVPGKTLTTSPVLSGQVILAAP